MKTFQCKKSLLAVGLAVALASPTAFAGFDSDLVNSDGQVDFEVQATVASVVQIKLPDLSPYVDLGEYNPVHPEDTVADINDVCLYSNTGTIMVEASSTNADSFGGDTYGSLQKAGGSVGVDGGDIIPYHLKLFEGADASSGANPVALLGLGSGPQTLAVGNPAVSLVPCDGTSATHLASMEITADQHYSIFPTAGTYSDTVLITVNPG